MISWDVRILEDLGPKKPLPNPKEPKDILLSDSPWMSNTKALAYLGPFSIEVVVPESDEEDRVINGIIEALQNLQLIVLSLKSESGKPNAITGIEHTINPWDPKGWVIHAWGTVAVLESLV